MIGQTELIYMNWLVKTAAETLAEVLEFSYKLSFTHLTYSITYHPSRSQTKIFNLKPHQA